jgi:hypothetical protein
MAPRPWSSWNPALVVTRVQALHALDSFLRAHFGTALPADNGATKSRTGLDVDVPTEPGRSPDGHSRWLSALDN